MVLEAGFWKTYGHVSGGVLFMLVLLDTHV
jgi:hypothetical protein